MSIYDSLGGTAGATATAPTATAPSKGTIYDSLQAAPPKAPEPSLISKVASFVMPQQTGPSPSLYDNVAPKAPDDSIMANTRATVGGAISGFQDTPSAPKNPDIIQGVTDHNVFTAAHDAWTKGIDSISNHMATVADSRNSRLDIAVAEGLTVTDTIKTGFGILLSPFETYASIPGVGHLYDGINKVFGAIGGAGSASATELLRTLPLSQETKDKLHPLVSDLGALMAQIAAGKGFDTVGGGIKGRLTEISDKAKLVTSTIKDDPVVKQATTGKGTPVPDVVTKLMDRGDHSLGAPDVIPKETYEEYAKYPKETIKVDDIQGLDHRGLLLDAEKPGRPITEPIMVDKNADGTYQLRDGNRRVTQAMVDKLPTIEAFVKPLEAKPLEGTAPQEVAKSASDINQTFAEKGIQTIPHEELAKFTPTTIKEQTSRVSELMSKSIDDAKAMVLDKMPIPNDIHPRVLFNAMVERAKEIGDYDLMRKMAGSKHAESTSLAGQELSLQGHTGDAHSPVEIIRSVKKTREKSAEKRSGKTIDKAKSELITKHKAEMKSEIKAKVSKRPTWDEFIKEIQCSY